MRKPILVVLSHYPDILEGFRARVNEYEPDLSKIIVRDGELVPWHIDGWSVVDGDLPFRYTRNVNLGWRITGNADVILCGDDMRFEEPFADELQRTAYSDPTVGVATIQLHGQSPFVCGYFKREVLTKVGEMDERFNAYGEDDVDWCHRMELAGYHTLCTDRIKATHNGGSTFFRKQREEGGETIQEGNARMKKVYEAKWGPEKLENPLADRIKLE